MDIHPLANSDFCLEYEFVQATVGMVLLGEWSDLSFNQNSYSSFILATYSFLPVLFVTSESASEESVYALRRYPLLDVAYRPVGSSE